MPPARRPIERLALWATFSRAGGGVRLAYGARKPRAAAEPKAATTACFGGSVRVRQDQGLPDRRGDPDGPTGAGGLLTRRLMVVEDERKQRNLVGS